MKSKLTIIFTSDWQISSGIGDGHWADSMLVRNERGLPYIPGRALKGALREGAWFLTKSGRRDLCAALDLFFGTRSSGTQREVNEPGITYVRSAQLPPAFISLFPKDCAAFDGLVADLTCSRIQTALENGQVKAGSLRTAECGIPGLFFDSELEVDTMGLKVSEKWVKDYFTAVCAAVRSMGANRSRGLGCCRLRLDDSNPQRVMLPEEVEDVV
jgi:CRISPR/Cas system CSM-associated protein Csm3 (group 7 of RAMP superfamily)